MTAPSLSNAADARSSLLDELSAVCDHAAGRPISIAEVVRLFRHRGPAMVMLVLTLPCIVPVLAAAMAYVTGPAVAFFGLQLACRLPPWIPGWLGRRELSNHAVVNLVGFARRWGGPVEKMLRPRLAFMAHPAADVVVGLALLFLGVFLFVPWLVPGTNEVPGLVIAVLLLGLIERDGLFVLAGLGLTLAIVLTCGYVGLLFERHGIRGGWHMLHHPGHAAPASSTRP